MKIFSSVGMMYVNITFTLYLPAMNPVDDRSAIEAPRPLRHRGQNLLDDCRSFALQFAPRPWYHFVHT
jgi:hypothetical protein